MRRLGRLGLGDARIADEQQLGVEAEIPERHRGLQAADAHRADAELRASGADERRDALGAARQCSDPR